VKGMDTQLGLQALTSLLSTDAAQVGVFNVDWDRFKVAVPREDTYTLLSAVYAAVEADRSSADALTEAARALREQIGTLTPDEAKTQILDYLFHVLARTVELDASKQAELKPIFKHLRVNELGVDSLMAVQLRNRILPELNVDIPIPMFIGGSKVADIADVIYRQSVLSRLADHAATEVGASGTETEEFVL
jgi:acyl carrier protein